MSATRVSLLAGAALAFSLVVYGADSDPRLREAFRNPAKDGWTYVHLEGSPAEIGFQHGYLLTAEIEDAKRAIELGSVHELKQSWQELRAVGNTVLLPHVPEEYQQEMQGMAAGLRAHGSKLDLLDLVVMNASMELPYYYDEARKNQAKGVPSSVGEHCSAFVATGSYTKDGRIVIGHNNWSDYLTGSRWNIVLDISPATGHHFIMDGVPGLIHSGDDFGMNDAGIVITETTIANFHGFDRNGVPEFVRARKAMQYSGTVDDFVRIMKAGNNGGYASTWLIGDTKKNEIARLELGLKHVTLERTSDGYFSGANFPINPKLTAEETDFPANDPEAPNLIRRRRWDQLMAEFKGKIDVEAGKKFETDHYDALTKEIDPNERTICGHVDKSNRGLKGWQGPYGPAGAVEAKVADAAMVEKLSFVAGAGHPCGLEFHAADFLKEHKEYDWQSPLLRDLKANPWSVVSAGTRKESVTAQR
jgi:Phospholipase B